MIKLVHSLPRFGAQPLVPVAVAAFCQRVAVVVLQVASTGTDLEQITDTCSPKLSHCFCSSTQSCTDHPCCECWIGPAWMETFSNMLILSCSALLPLSSCAGHVLPGHVLNN